MVKNGSYGQFRKHVTLLQNSLKQLRSGLGSISKRVVLPGHIKLQKPKSRLNILLPILEKTFVDFSTF